MENCHSYLEEIVVTKMLNLDYRLDKPTLQILKTTLTRKIQLSLHQKLGDAMEKRLSSFGLYLRHWKIGSFLPLLHWQVTILYFFLVVPQKIVFLVLG